MTSQQIKAGLEIIKQEAKEQNKTTKATCVNWGLFCIKLEISKKDFLLNFNKHPFSIVRGRVMSSF